MARGFESDDELLELLGLTAGDLEGICQTMSSEGCSTTLNEVVEEAAAPPLLPPPPPPLPPLIRDGRARVSATLAWAGAHLRTALCFENSAACHGVGAFAPRQGASTGGFHCGDTVLQLSRAAVVTQQTCLAALPTLDALRAAGGQGSLPEFSSFVLWLAQQRLLGECERRCSAFGAWVLTLLAPADLRATALFMDDAAFAALGNIQAAAPAAAAPAAPAPAAAVTAAAVTAAAAVVAQSGGGRELDNSIRAARFAACRVVRARVSACLNFIEARNAEALLLVQQPLVPAGFDRALGTWAAAILLSRAFCVNSRMLLLPVIDLVNSSRDAATCELQFDAAGAPLLRATARVPAGSEVFVNYGAEKSDADLFACYGYCE